MTLVFLFLVIVIVCLIAASTRYYLNYPDPIPGDIFTLDAQLDNPFSRDRDYITVFDVRDGWVQFCLGKVELNSSLANEKYLHSMEITALKAMYTKVDNKN